MAREGKENGDRPPTIFGLKVALHTPPHINYPIAQFHAVRTENLSKALPLPVLLQPFHITK